MDLILGTAQLVTRYGAIDRRSRVSTHLEATEVLNAAAAAGFAALDTAPAYGQAESVIGSSNWTGAVFTKIDGNTDPATSVAGSVERLNNKQIAGLLLHDPSALFDGRTDVLDAAGKAAASVGAVLGASLYTHLQLARAAKDTRIHLVQVPLHPLSPPSMLDDVAEAGAAGKAIHARSVLLQGLLVADPATLADRAGHLAPYVLRFQQLAFEATLTPLALAMAWAGSRDGVAGVVVGADQVADVAELAEAARIHVDPAVLAEVDRLARPSSFATDPRRWEQRDGAPRPPSTPPPARVVAVVQARTGSVRLPEKVIAEVLGRPLLAHLLDRLNRASRIDRIIVARPAEIRDEVLDPIAEQGGADVVAGSESDVLDRFHAAAATTSADIVVRITADCPLVDPGVVDEVVGVLIDEDCSFAATSERYPDGFDVEAMTTDALHAAWRSATDRSDREHVTPWIRRGSIELVDLDLDVDRGDVRVTVDTPDDLTVVTNVFTHFGHNRMMLQDVCDLFDTQPDLFEHNRGSIRNDGSHLGTGQKLWQRARRVIPGGNMLLSKRSEMNLPGQWPTYFSKAAGCTVWDLDGKPYTDCGLMGVGTNILGYGHPDVDAAVRNVINTGNLSTLNCPEEVWLAELLVELHPWSDMARFTRSGGEACAVAARIARAASGRDTIAVCGYHGWHDWYLAANLAGDQLDQHLLPGLEPAGVPSALAGSVAPFNYGDLDALRLILERGDVGVVYTEVQRSAAPPPGYLEGVREMATAHGAVLVFDECTSGFRKVLGGHHLTLGVEPDLAVFGKTLGNGYAINAIIGRREVMEHAQDTFISSTFWTERIGPAAALASLRAMGDEAAPQRVDQIGASVKAGWIDLASHAGLTLEVAGLDALASFAVVGRDALIVKSYLTQTLLDAGYLGGTLLYASIAHTPEVIEPYLQVLGGAFRTIADVDSDAELALLLRGPVCHGTFARLA